MSLGKYFFIYLRKSENAKSGIFFPLNGNERHSYKLKSAHNRLQMTVVFAEKI